MLLYLRLIYEMDGHPAFYSKRLRRRIPSSDNDIPSRGNCASLSCDIDAKISCGGKTFEKKFIGSNNEREQRRKH